jgi:ornithine cyclodeaminase/alanine dehydrogenase
MRYVTEAEVEELLSPADALDAVAGSLGRLARGEVESPPRVGLALPDGQFAIMGCVDRGLGYAGLKTYVWTPDRAPFLVVLFTLGGELAAVVEASKLGELRTAAASAVAATHLARGDVSTLGVIGSGRQAASHVAAFRDAFPSLTRTIVYGRDEQQLAAFCRDHGCEPAASHRDPAGCDIVVTATTSRDPVLRGEWLNEGSFVCAVGANDPKARELDNAVLQRASFICVDSRDEARAEAGDLIEPVASGVLDWLEVHELQDLVAGTVTGREQDEEITLFKSNGMAAWDVAAAARVLDRLRE